MAANGLVTVEANRLLDNTIVTNSTVDLVTTMGTASAAPTKVTGGSYAAQTPTWAAASAAEKHNSATVTFAGLPAATIVGVDVANTVPNRTWFAPFTTSRTTLAGDSLVFATTTGLSFTFTNSP